MPADDQPTRREFDQLTTRLNRIDDLGTRGTLAAISIVQAQVAELIKDIGKLEGRLDAHDLRHDREERQRASNRKWVATTLIAAIVMLISVLSLTLSIAFNLH
jgi:hypothetical protein